VASRQAALWMGTARWEARRQQLFNAEPLCRMCAWYGRVVAATVADHCIPHRDDPDLFWRGELQPLCAPCHDSAKQEADLRGYYVLGFADGWTFRIGLEGGFPRTGDNLDARVAAFEARGVGQNSSAFKRLTGGDPSRRVSFENRGRAARG